MNPETLSQPPRETAQTLVHEMVHLWQRDHGKPSRSGYHNREWVKKMRELGLEPVSLDGKDGTGQRVSGKVIEGGCFALAFADMQPQCHIPYKCRPERRRRRRDTADHDHDPADVDEDPDNGTAPLTRNKIKYTCPSCEANVWGKPGLRIACEDCDLSFDEQD